MVVAVYSKSIDVEFKSHGNFDFERFWPFLLVKKVKPQETFSCDHYQGSETRLSTQNL